MSEKRDAFEPSTPMMPEADRRAAGGGKLPGETEAPKDAGGRPKPTGPRKPRPRRHPSLSSGGAGA